MRSDPLLCVSAAGTSPIVVTELRVSKCVNIRQVCGVYTPNALVAPGRTVIALRVEPAVDGDAFSFYYEFRWQESP
jgi:hypothetical protein